MREHVTRKKPGIIGLGNDNCKMRRETFKFGGLVRLLLDILRYLCASSHWLRPSPVVGEEQPRRVCNAWNKFTLCRGRHMSLYKSQSNTYTGTYAVYLVYLP